VLFQYNTNYLEWSHLSATAAEIKNIKTKKEKNIPKRRNMGKEKTDKTKGNGKGKTEGREKRREEGFPHF
jgi:hypothetical protein